MIKTKYSNRSKSVGMQQSSSKSQNLSSTGYSINQCDKQQNKSQVQTPVKQNRNFNIKIQEFNPSNDSSKNKGFSELSTLPNLQTKETVFKRRQKSNDFDNSLGNLNHSQSELYNVPKGFDNMKGSQNGKLKSSNNLEQYYQQQHIQNEFSNSGSSNDKYKLPKDQFASTSTDLNQKSQRQQCPLVPQFPLNKVQFQITQLPKVSNSSTKKGESKTSFLIENNSSQKIEMTYMDSKTNFNENNQQQSYSTHHSPEASNKQIDKSTMKTLYFLSSHIKNPRSMIMSQNDVSNYQSQKQIQTHTSIIASMNDIDEYSKQPQCSEQQNELFNSKMIKQNSSPDLLKLNKYLSHTNKKQNSVHQGQDPSETKSPKVVNFSLNNLPESRSKSRGNTKKSILLQDGREKKRQLSFKERQLNDVEKDFSPISPSMKQIQFSLLAFKQQSSQQISSMVDLQPQTLSIISPVSQRRGESLIKSDSHIKLENQQSMQSIKSKSDIKFKKVDNNKSIISNLLPMSLKRIVEKPFKQNIEILKYGIDRQDPKGPKISITEYELFTLFHRVIDHYDTAIKNENDVFRKMHSTQAALYDRLCTKIVNVSDAIKAINTIKDGNSKISKIIYKIFETIKHLRFIFFETEAVTDQMQAVAEINQKEEICPPLLFGGLHNISEIALRLYHHNFKQFFTQHNFDILLEYIIFPDLDALQTKIESYVNRFNVNNLQKISENIETTIGDMFKKQSEYIYMKKNPQRICEAFSYQTPSFTTKGYNFTNTFFKKMNKFESKTNSKVQKSESQFQFNGQMDNLVQDITKTLKKYQFESPYSEEINPELKQQLVKMYNNTSQEI